MIQSNELRRMNWVQYAGTADTVKCIDFNMVHLTQSSSLEYRDLEPIALTVELLEKIGFVKDEDAGNWHCSEHTIYSCMGESVGVKDDYIGWYFSAQDDFYSYFKKLDSLHQLQNLFFAITGKELEITL